jgi:hypothetical protein
VSLHAEPLESEATTLAILRDLYDSEINYAVSCLWDGGYDVRLGDDLNGYDAVVTGLQSWHEVAQWLKDAAISLYPVSAFARIYAPAVPGA